MYCNYKIKNGDTLHVWIDLDYVDGISTADVTGINRKDIKEERCRMFKNDSGKLVFDFRGEEVEVASAEVHSMAEIREMMDKGNVICDDMMLAIIGDGMENVRFMTELDVPDMVMCGIGVCSGKKRYTECKLVPEFNRMPHGNYKLSLVAVEGSDGYGNTCKEQYYTSDMMGLIRKGFIKIGDSVADDKTAKQHFEEYIDKVLSKAYYK